MAWVRSRLQEFGADRSGSVAMMFILVLIIMMFVIGIAIDLGRAQRASADVVGAIDTAALAAAKAVIEDDLTDAEVTKLVEQYLAVHIDAGELRGGSFSGVHVVVDRKEGTVQIDLDVRVPTTLTRVARQDAIQFHKFATATYKPKNVELAMVLDTTGSMTNNNKIDDLKTAASQAVDILLPAGEPLINRVALAPYSASIRVTPFSGSVSGGTSTDCVVERDGADAFTDAAPASSPVGTSDSGTNGRYSCPGQTIMPLSKNATALKAAINSYVAGGGTAGQVGLAWGWYQVSPNWKTLFPKASQPKPYKDPNTIKSIILMTDGAFNTAYFNGPVATDADQEATSTSQTLQLCDAIKASGISIYTIGFDLASNPPPGDVTAPILLSDCASDNPDGGKEYYDAADGGALSAAFKKIATKLSALRMSH